jgi:hypothetical protein
MDAAVDARRALILLLCEDLMQLGHATEAQRLEAALEAWRAPATTRDDPRPRWFLANALVKAADVCNADADELDPARDVVRAVLRSVATAARLLTVALRDGQEGLDAAAAAREELGDGRPRRATWFARFLRAHARQPTP